MFWSAGKIWSHALSTVLLLLSQSKSLEETSESHKTIAWCKTWCGKPEPQNEPWKVSWTRVTSCSTVWICERNSILLLWSCTKTAPPQRKVHVAMSPLKPMVLKTNSATTNISPLHLSLNISKHLLWICAIQLIQLPTCGNVSLMYIPFFPPCGTISLENTAGQFVVQRFGGDDLLRWDEGQIAGKYSSQLCFARLYKYSISSVNYHIWKTPKIMCIITFHFIHLSLMYRYSESIIFPGQEPISRTSVL